MKRTKHPDEEILNSITQTLMRKYGKKYLKTFDIVMSQGKSVKEADAIARLAKSAA